MPDLEALIAEWRRVMRAHGLRSAVLLEELEDHLRDDIDRRVGAGEGMPGAFHQAAGRLGGGPRLCREFQKLTSIRIMKTKLIRALIVVALIAVQTAFLLPPAAKLRDHQALAAMDIAALMLASILCIGGIVCLRRIQLKA